MRGEGAAAAAAGSAGDEVEEEEVDEGGVELITLPREEEGEGAVEDEAAVANFVPPEPGTIASVLRPGEQLGATSKQNAQRARLGKTVLYCTGDGWLRAMVESIFGGRSAKKVGGIVVEYWLKVDSDGLATKHRADLDKACYAAGPDDMTAGHWAFVAGTAGTGSG